MAETQAVTNRIVSAFNDINSSFDVSIQDQTTEIINLFFHNTVNSITNLTDAILDAKNITFDSVSLPIAGQIICIKTLTQFYQGIILSVTDNGSDNYTCVIDTPLDGDYNNFTCAVIGSREMNVDGSSVKKEFSITPSFLADGTKWDITQITFEISDGSDMDDGKFGGLTKLTNGIVLRKEDGSVKNLMNVKANGEFSLQSCDIQYSSKAPAGTYTLIAKKTYGGQDKQGVVIRLSKSDTLKLIIYDNLTGLTSFKACIQGHVVD